MSVIIKRLGYTNISSTSPGAKYTRSFTSGDWTLNGSDYEYTIPQSIHTKGTNIQVQVFQLVSGSFEEVIVGVVVESNGDLTIKVNTSPDARFSGKVLIN
jgi:hypothetical protein